MAAAASIAGYAVAFVAVLIAHQGFAPVLAPLIDVAWVYDVGFLLFALVPLGAIAHRFFGALDPLVQFLTADLLGTESRASDPGVGGEDRR